MATAKTALADSAPANDNPDAAALGAMDEGKSNLDTFNAKVAAGYIERIMDKHEEADKIGADIQAIYDEMEEAGYSPKYARKAIKELRKPMKHEDREGTNRYLKAAGYQGDLFAPTIKH